MLYPLTPGIDIRTDTVPSEAAREEEYYAAGSNIPVGAPVILDTSSSSGKLVGRSTALLGYLCKGVYEGKGGTGPTVAVTTGLSGRAAVTGDVLRITRHGVASTFVSGSVSTGTVGVGVPLGLTVINGVFTDAAALPAGVYAAAVLLEAVTAQGASSSAGMVRKVHLSLV